MSDESDRVPPSWRELIASMAPRVGMYVGSRERYDVVAGFIQGFAEGHADGHILHGFQLWLSGQPQHQPRCNFVWWHLVLDELHPDRRTPPNVPDWPDCPEWPRPADGPMTASELRSDAEHKEAIAHLFARLTQYLDERDAALGLVGEDVR